MFDTPVDLVETVHLKDGAPVAVRPIRPDDAARLQHFHSHLSPESIRFRYFSFHPELTDAEARHLTHLDRVKRMAFVATVVEEGAEEIIGVARYDAGESLGDGAEFAIILRDDYQGRGLGHHLFHRLAAHARQQGIRSVSGELLSENVRMLRFLRSLGYPLTLSHEGCDEICFRLDLTRGPESTN